MGGIEYVYWPGTTTRLTPWMRYCLERLDTDLRRLFDVHLTLDSSVTQRGIRTHEEQRNLFLSRYSVQWAGYGPFRDVRYWEGRRYVRHSGLGTVAQPGTSNHEIQEEYYAAIDLADSGDAGIGTMGSNRSNWLKANAGKYGLEPEGFKFKEAWHYRVPNIFQSLPAQPAGKPQELEKIMSNLGPLNVVPKNGDDPNDMGTIWTPVHEGPKMGTFEKYEPPYDPNVRNVLSVAYYGGKPMPTLVERDFQTVQRFFRAECGKTTK